MTQNSDITYMRGQLDDVKSAVSDLRKDVETCRAQGVAIAALQHSVDEIVTWKRDMESKLFRLVLIVALAALGGGGVAGVAKNALSYLMSQPVAAQTAPRDAPSDAAKTAPPLTP